MEKFKIGDKVRLYVDDNETKEAIFLGYNESLKMVKLKFEGQKQEFLTDIGNIELIIKPTETPLTKERLLNCEGSDDISETYMTIKVNGYFLNIDFRSNTIQLDDDCEDLIVLPIPFTEEALSAQYKLFTGKELSFDKKVWKKVVEVGGEEQEIRISKNDSGRYETVINGKLKAYQCTEIADVVSAAIQNTFNLSTTINQESIFKQFGFE